MRLKTSSPENRKQPSRLRSSVCVERGATVAEIVEDARVGIEFLVLVLREVIGLRRCGPSVYSPVGQRLGAGQQLDQRRLAGAVHAHQRDAVAALDHEVRRSRNTCLSP